MPINTSKNSCGSKSVAKTLAKIGDDFNKKYTGQNRGMNARSGVSGVGSRSGYNSRNLNNINSNNNSLTSNFNKSKQSSTGNKTSKTK